ncbi:MAG: GNAT family N-acetyltransferase [Clostridia bacterium]|nr:GNAT family N-acetyltransferase [Clostridia bacterium]
MNKEIKTDRLVLAPMTEKDEQAMVDILTNDEIKQTYMVPDYTEREKVAALFEKIKAISHTDGRFCVGIYKDGRLIGFMNETGVEVETIEIGYVIHPSHKNNGYATEALKAAITELFARGYKTIRAGFFEENIASRRVMEKAGMNKIDMTEEVEYRGKTHHCIYFEAVNNEK